MWRLVPGRCAGDRPCRTSKARAGADTERPPFRHSCARQAARAACSLPHCSYDGFFSVFCFGRCQWRVVLELAAAAAALRGSSRKFRTPQGHRSNTTDDMLWRGSLRGQDRRKEARSRADAAARASSTQAAGSCCWRSNRA